MSKKDLEVRLKRRDALRGRLMSCIPWDWDLAHWAQCLASLAINLRQTGWEPALRSLRPESPGSRRLVKALLRLVKGGGPQAAMPLLEECDNEGYLNEVRNYITHRLYDELVGAEDKASQTRKRRRLPPKTITPLSEKQIEALQLVAANNGSITAAARAAGKSRQAMGKLYKKGNAKIASKTPLKPKTQRLPQDRRGQANVPAPEPEED
jgi:hypothetical protein